MIKLTSIKYLPHIILGLVLLLLYVATAQFVFAADHTVDYVSLAGIPGVDPNDVDLVGYLNTIFLISISVGALLAVIKIAIAGVTYMTSEIITDKSEAKKGITGALLGLGILLATYIVLWQINPDLVEFKILENTNAIRVNAPTPPAQTLNDVYGIDTGLTPAQVAQKRDECLNDPTKPNAEYVRVDGSQNTFQCRYTTTQTPSFLDEYIASATDAELKETAEAIKNQTIDNTIMLRVASSSEELNHEVLFISKRSIEDGFCEDVGGKLKGMGGIYMYCYRP